MALCAYAIGAGAGAVYIRSEYPAAQARMQAAIEQASAAGFLGTRICGSGFSFEVRVVSGHGSYVCGEETALLNAIEGGRGEVRVRPPYPAAQGLYGQPTIVNNIETLVNIPWIVERGGAAFRRLGTADSPGTKAFCFNQGFARPGIVEAEFGLSLRELVETHGGGSRDGQPLAGIVLGGPMGSILLARLDGALAGIHGRRVVRQVRPVSSGFGSGAGIGTAGRYR
jgi:NADH:ubiquinone oxidoreductase subunit F (NADH-binding)